MLKWREDYYVGEGIKDAAKARKRIDEIGRASCRERV